MHAPNGPVAGTASASGSAAGSDAGSARPDADGHRSLPRLTLRGRRAGRDRSADASTAPTAASPAAGPRRAGTTTLVDTADEHGGGDDLDWRVLSVFGAGLALGAALGAATALLLAPASGFETRMRLARGARLARERAADRVDVLGDRVRDNARRRRRDLERKLIRARWRAQDAWERKRFAGE